MVDIRIPNGILTVVSNYKAGDLPPEGYLEWHEWAEVQRRSGIKQVTCGKCGVWNTPQELSDSTRISRGFTITNAGRVYHEETLPICTKCNKKETP